VKAGDLVRVNDSCEVEEFVGYVGLVQHVEAAHNRRGHHDPIVTLLLLSEIRFLFYASLTVIK
jgi:hypothetical protein